MHQRADQQAHRQPYSSVHRVSALLGTDASSKIYPSSDDEIKVHAEGSDQRTRRLVNRSALFIYCIFMSYLPLPVKNVNGHRF